MGYPQTLDRISGDFSPEADFRKRGVWTNDFPHRYAYRDYGMMYWHAIFDWVTDYLDVSEILCAVRFAIKRGSTVSTINALQVHQFRQLWHILPQILS